MSKTQVKVAERYSAVPQDVLAVQWDGSTEHAKLIAAWSEGKVSGAYVNRQGVLTVEPGNNPALSVDTPYGKKIAKPTDYVIRNEQGSFYTDPAAVFEAAFQKSS